MSLLMNQNVQATINEISDQPRILIVGAGIAGVATAIGLHNLGLKPDIIERNSDAKPQGTGIALPANAVWVLEQLGLSQEIEEKARLINAMEFTDDKGNHLAYHEINNIHNSGTPFRAIHRTDLHQILLEKLPAQIVQYNTTVETLVENETGLEVTLNNGQMKIYDLVIGADGIHSQIKAHLYGNQPLEYQNIRNWRAVIGQIDGLENPTYMLGTNTIFLLYPINDGQIYLYAQSTDSNHQRDNPQTRLEAFKELFAAYEGYVPQALSQLQSAEQLIPGFLDSVKEVQWGKGRVLLIGDAAHACSPSLQQGGAQALEDAYVLQAELAKGLPLTDTIHNFVQRRNERVNKVVTMSASPVKLIANDQMHILYEMIKKNGAPNVAAFKMLMQINP